MKKIDPEKDQYFRDLNSYYMVDLPDDQEDGDEASPGFLSRELQEYANALKEKINLARKQGKQDLVPVLEAIARDMFRLIEHYEEGDISFHKCYEEIVSLYVFVEIYFKLDGAK